MESLFILISLEPQFRAMVYVAKFIFQLKSWTTVNIAPQHFDSCPGEYLLMVFILLAKKTWIRNNVIFLLKDVGIWKCMYYFSNSYSRNGLQGNYYLKQISYSIPLIQNSLSLHLSYHTLWLSVQKHMQK